MGQDLVNRFVADDHRETVALELRKALLGEQTGNFDFPLITKTGRRVEILLNATPRYNELGQIFGVMGIGQDITERIAQEQEYIRLIDTANAPIFGVDSEGRVNIWNKKAAEIMQYTTDAVIGEKLVEKYITKDYQEAVSSVLSEALKGVETANFEFPLITKAGRRVEILLNATPRYNEHGVVIGMVGIGQDITDRIAQEQEYTRLIDTANAPIFGVDSSGHVNIWNRKAADIMQYTNEEVLGKDLVAEFISEEYKDPVRSVLEKAFEDVETANFEFPLITKAGRRVEILLNATPRYNEHGEVRGMVGIGQDITERIAQEQEYTRLIDTANAPIFGVDINGHVNIWNRKAANITQYTNKDVLGKDLVAEFISAEYKVPVRSVLEKAFEGVETANFEFPLITKAGRRVEILLNATPRYNEHGEVRGMVGIGQDITERIAQEQEYTRLIDTANAPIFGVDANMKAAQITNYSIEEVMGENLVETFISPEFRPIVAEVLSQALQGVETANFEFPLITRPGTRIEILLNATPRYDANGSIVGVVGIGQDITDRIAQEHEYFRLIDTANAPIFGIDTNGRINEWNQKIEEITGYHKSSVLGLSLVHTFVTPESRQQVRQLLNQALIGIDVGEMELPMTTKRGVFLLLLVNASSKKDMHGNIRGVIGVGQDYTARKHMEAAKVNFLASFSHELRTPLNGVLGMLELLKEQPLDKSIERYVHMAYVSGSLLLNLINDILDLSKIEAGHMEITTAPFQMHDLLDYSIEIFKFKARERGLKLELKCGDNVPKVVIGDVVRLRQVLLNLLSNAIKFTNDGSITVACSVVHSPELPAQFKKLLFQVIDTGIGMDAEEKMRLFSLFTKLERTRQNNPTGSGLGLAICKQLAELMDGSIDVDSELGVGSNFFFTVLVRLIDEVDPKLSYYSSEDFLLDPSTALLSPDGAVRSGENGGNASVRLEVPNQARILVVEDNEFNWEVVKCFLQQDDHLLQWEVNGRDAVKAYTEYHEQFDLIFMDCEMPIMDGYTATATLREFEKEHNLPRIPILGLTAYAMSGDRQKCLNCGMDEFMVKPISKLSLRKAIRQWMRIRYLGQQHAALVEPGKMSARDAQRSPESMNPTLWSHPPFSKKDLPSGRLQSWSGLMPKKKVSFHEDTDFESSHSSRLAHNGDGTMPSVLERMETDTSVDEEPLAVQDESAKGGASVAAHTMDPMSIEIPEGDPVNYSLGVEQCGGQEELFLTLLEKFATTSEEITKRVIDAHQCNDFDTARREAHSLKGSSAYVAALRVSKSAFRVQVAFEHVISKQSTGGTSLNLGNMDDNNHESRPSALRVKIISMGESGVGKSCVIKRYCEEKFVSKYISTIGIDYGVKPVMVNGSEVRVNFWDLSGMPEYLEVRNEFYKDTQGGILMFDVSSRRSFESLDNWLREAAKFGAGKFPCILCGNKVDRPRVVSEDEGKAYAQAKGFEYFETSACTGVSITEAFHSLFSTVVKHVAR
ncbi:hypothetical protein G195_010639 [Phytophthora kernoviae 00238/432]|uniref:histidine kinase n=1 Tax=Phytophthora kernoviae 00238/432 TaxID=1284355 RepID=A0A8J4S4D0_9STRA|nr:hypothetical protein G195_010639 [Phytophthora kernoviae 00238/432]